MNSALNSQKSSQKSSRSIGIIGAGRVGAVLGAAFVNAGHQVVAAVGVSTASKARAEQLLPGVALLPADQVAASADLVLLAVPDDVLAGLVHGLVETGALRAGQIVAHTSGAHGLDVLAPVTAAGARPLALHPAMTFTGTAVDLSRLAAGVSFGVTAPDDLRDLAASLVADLGGQVEWIEEERRPLYHAALAHGANHLATLVNEALDRLRDAGVQHPEQVLAPLLGAALDNSLRLGDAAITGPVSRGDAGTVAKHLRALDAVAPESVPPYLALARRTADRVIAAGRLRPMDAEPLLDVLSGSGHKGGDSGQKEGSAQKQVPVVAAQRGGRRKAKGTGGKP
ncbi:hypothetical protein GCM10009827_082920 [Dactylosporangium maewongense]|uniref:Short-subunit dehydrogenase-like oxidoreductase (DUF2520 family) n=1 Tax=Dactylosporangium maewongense TaxID=634393 RepID=A0ABP4MSZ4_9ACTN